jgi:hypothetical protein
MSQNSGQSSSESGDHLHYTKLLHPNNIKTARDGIKYYSRAYEPPYQQLINKIVSVKWGDGNIYTGKFSNQTRIRSHTAGPHTADYNTKQYKFMYDDGDKKWYQLHKTVEGDIIAIDRYGFVKRFFFGPKSVEQNPKLTPHPTTTSGQNTQQSKSVYHSTTNQPLPLGSDKEFPEYARETRVDESSGSRGGTRKRKTRKRKKTRKKRRKKKRKKRRKKKKTRRKK